MISEGGLVIPFNNSPQPNARSQQSPPPFNQVPNKTIPPISEDVRQDLEKLTTSLERLMKRLQGQETEEVSDFQQRNALVLPNDDFIHRFAIVSVPHLIVRLAQLAKVRANHIKKAQINNHANSMNFVEFPMEAKRVMEFGQTVEMLNAEWEMWVVRVLIQQLQQKQKQQQMEIGGVEGLRRVWRDVMDIGRGKEMCERVLSVVREAETAFQ
jgi:hypothetical protein